MQQKNYTRIVRSATKCEETLKKLIVNGTKVTRKVNRNDFKPAINEFEEELKEFLEDDLRELQKRKLVKWRMGVRVTVLGMGPTKLLRRCKIKKRNDNGTFKVNLRKKIEGKKIHNLTEDQLELGYSDTCEWIKVTEEASKRISRGIQQFIDAITDVGKMMNVFADKRSFEILVNNLKESEDFTHGKCLSGKHGLKCFKQSDYEFNGFQMMTWLKCDVCQEFVEPNSTMYGCRPCNWDVCENCKKEEEDIL